MARALFVLALIAVVLVAPLSRWLRGVLTVVLLGLAGVVFYLSDEQERVHAVEHDAAELAERLAWSEGDGGVRLGGLDFRTPLYFGDRAEVELHGLADADPPPAALELAVAAYDCPGATGDLAGCLPVGTATAVVELVTGDPAAARSFSTRLRFDGLPRPSGTLRFAAEVVRVRR